MENFKIKKSQKEPVSDAKVFIDNKDETRLYNIYSVKGRVYARAKRGAISNSKLIKPEWGMIPMITKKDVTKSDYQRLLKYPWFYPTITKKQKRYLPDLFRNIDDDLEVLKGEQLSVKTVKYSLQDGRSVSHCDVIFMYKIKNQGFKFFNINQLIIRKKINDKNELIVELNASALSKLNMQISKSDGVVIYPPIFWYTVHERQGDLNFNKSGVLYAGKSNGLEEFDYSIYDKGKEKKKYFESLQQVIDYLH